MTNIFYQTNYNMETKKTIRITESELKKFITESVKQILSEADIWPGTNKYKEIYHGADDMEEYETDINKSATVNDMAPDFVYTLATRLEKQLNLKCPQIFPNVEYCEFDVDVHVDNKHENYETRKTKSKSTEHRLIFNISWDVALEKDEMILNDDRRFNNRIKSFVAKTSTMMLGNLEGADVSFGESRGSSMVIIVSFTENEEWYDYGHYDGPRKIKNKISPLFKNNPARQIPGKNY